MAWKNYGNWKKKPVEPKGPPMEKEAFIKFWTSNAGLAWEEAQKQGYTIQQCTDCKCSTCKGWHIAKIHTAVMEA